MIPGKAKFHADLCDDRKRWVSLRLLIYPEGGIKACLACMIKVMKKATYIQGGSKRGKEKVRP